MKVKENWREILGLLGLVFGLAVLGQLGLFPELSTEESPPEGAVEAIHYYIDFENNFNRAYHQSSWLVYDIVQENVQVLNAKQISLSNRHLWDGALEQWCISVTYDYRSQRDENGEVKTRNDLFLAGRYEEGWWAYRANYFSFDRFSVSSLAEKWDYFCPDVEEIDETEPALDE